MKTFKGMLNINMYIGNACFSLQFFLPYIVCVCGGGDSITINDYSIQTKPLLL